MPSAKDAFMSAYLKGAEARILTGEHVDRVAKLSTVQDVASGIREVMDIIKDTEAGRYLAEAMVKTFDDSDRYLWLYFSGCLSRLEGLKLVPDGIRRVLAAYVVKYDAANIKAKLQGLATGRKASLIPVGVMHNQGRLDELATVEGLGDVIRILVECRLGDYADILRDYSAEDAGARFLTEARLDGRYYENLLKVSRRIPDGFLLARVFSIVIDMTNLALVARALADGLGKAVGEAIIGGGYLISADLARELLSQKLSDLPSALGVAQYREIAEELVTGYGRTKSVTVVDEIIDKHRFRLLKEMLSPRVLTPMVIAWYLTIKELEVRNLRLILKAVFDAVPVEEIREYLVSV
ncbi:MAG: V-type ATPase subunit [Dehalococcoidales bacterium]|nr:V-type ATPase subunit [Dehalococcoidales bacterium]